MFHNFGAHDQIKGLLAQINEDFPVCPENLESSAQIVAASQRNSLFTQIYSHHGATSFQKFAAGEAIPASYVQNPRARRERISECENLRQKMPVHVRLCRTLESIFLVVTVCHC